MGLLSSLGLPPTPALRARKERETAELRALVQEAAQLTRELADAQAREQLAAALKAAAAAQKSASVEDRSGSTEQLKAALVAARRAVGLKVEDEEDEEDEARGPSAKKERKGDAKPIIGDGKFGGGYTSTWSDERSDGRGGSTRREKAFGGKASISYAEVPKSRPARYTLDFQFKAEVKGGLSAERRPPGDKDGRRWKASASASVSASVAFSMKHTFDAAELKRYLAAALAGQGGGHAELQLAARASADRVDDLDALLAQVRTLGGSVSGLRQMKDGDETSLELAGGAEGEVGGALRGVSLSLGVSVSGSLTRTIKLEKGCYVVTLAGVREAERHGALGAAAQYVGLKVGGQQNRRGSETLHFELAQDHPHFEARAARLLAARTVDEMRGLRAELKDVPSWDTSARSAGSGHEVEASLFGVGLGVGATRQRGEAATLGPDGKTVVVHDGSGGRSARLSVFGQPIASVGSDERVIAGADADNRGFGETRRTETESNIFASAKAVYDKVVGEGKVVGTVGGLATGEEEFEHETIHVEGMLLDDASYDRLIRLARIGGRPWGEFARGQQDTYTAWRKLGEQIYKARADRAQVARLLADFGAGSSRGRHDTLRGALTGAAVPFEFPDAIKAHKKSFDRLVGNDPLPAALKAGGELDVLQALGELEQDIGSFRATLVKHRQSFRRPQDNLDMCDRLDMRLRSVRAERRKREKLLEGANHDEQVSEEVLESRPEETPQEQAQADAAERVRELKEKISEAHEIEQRVFARWADDNRGEKTWYGGRTKADGSKVGAHARTLDELYVQWDRHVAELRRALAEAGPGYDPAEADVIVPDRARWATLRRQHPQAGWLMD